MNIMNMHTMNTIYIICIASAITQTLTSAKILVLNHVLHLGGLMVIRGEISPPTKRSHEPYLGADDTLV